MNTSLIGREWKRGDAWSGPELIRRGLDFEMMSGVGIFFLLSFEGARALAPLRPVTMPVWPHLFPFQTQKLSTRRPKVLGWRRPGRIGCRRLLKAPSISLGLFLFAFFEDFCYTVMSFI